MVTSTSGENLIVLDPSRMAAQIVSGIGFLGAGLIFVRRDAVRGFDHSLLDLGDCSGGDPQACRHSLVLAALTTGIYFLVTLVLPTRAVACRSQRREPRIIDGCATPTDTASCDKC